MLRKKLLSILLTSLVLMVIFTTTIRPSFATSQTLYAHQETLTLGSTSYDTLNTTSPDTAGAERSAQISGTSFIPLWHCVYPLNGIATLLSGTWNLKHRTKATLAGLYAQSACSVKIVMSNGTERTTIETYYSSEIAFSSSYFTHSWSFTMAANYTVVNQTDYAEVEFGFRRAVPASTVYIYIRVDDNTLSNSDNTQVTWLYGTAIQTSIGEFQAPATWLAQTYDYLNCSVWQIVSRNNIVNATVSINGTNGSPIILLWVNSTNTFSVFHDIGNFVTLDAAGSMSASVNSTAWKLSWRVLFNWNYSTGNKDVLSANTLVYDMDNNYGSGCQTSLFYFQPDLIVNSASLQDPDRVDPSSANTVYAQVYFQGTTTSPNSRSGYTVYASLNGVVKVSATPANSTGWILLNFTSEASSSSYSYLVYTTQDGLTSVQNKTVAVIVDRVEVTFSVDDEDVWAGVAVNFTLTFKSECDNSVIPAPYFDIFRNNTLWQDNIGANFTDTNSTAWTVFVYQFNKMEANDWNLTQIVSMPSDLSVLWYDKTSFIFACFTFDPADPQPYTVVSFNASASNSSSPITSYDWDFGDTEISAGITTTHAYNFTETFTVTLTVTSDVGTATMRQNITVSFFITAVFDWTPANPPLNTTISFDGTTSNSSSPITNWEWGFGDGNTTIGYYPTIDHAYAVNATFLVTLTVSNTIGTANMTLPVVVGWGANHTCPPTAPTPPETVVPQFFPTIRLDLSLLTTDLSFFWWQSTVTAKVLVINKATVGTDVTFTWTLLEAGKVAANGKQSVFISGLDKKEVGINIPAMAGNYTLKVESVAPVVAATSQSLLISQYLILGNAYHFFAVLVIVSLGIVFIVKRRRR